MENLLNDIQPLYKRLKEVRKEIRDWLSNHLKKIPHDKKRKDIELTVFSDILNMITKKWTIQILWELEIHKGLNFNTLNRHVKGMSSRTLSDRLKSLEENNLIIRTVENCRPPKVFYELNDKGAGLVELSLLIILHLMD